MNLSLSFWLVAHRGIEPLFQEWKSCVLADRRMGQYIINRFSVKASAKIGVIYLSTKYRAYKTAILIDFKKL